jgi:hypothetical protein
MEGMQKQLMNGFIKIILQIKHVPHIKLLDMITVLDAAHKLSARIVYHQEDVGL